MAADRRAVLPSSGPTRRFVDPETRTAWLAAGLNITDISGVRLQTRGHEIRIVEVLVSVSWFPMPDTTVRQGSMSNLIRRA